MIETISRTISFDDLVVDVEVWRFSCDKCGLKRHFQEDTDALHLGWQIYRDCVDNECSACPACSKAAPEKKVALVDETTGGM